MAKRKSVVQDLIELTGRFPWWVGVLLAVTSYLMLHHWATQEIIAPTKLGDMGKVYSGNLLRTLSAIGQYILPLVFLIGAVVSVIERAKRTRLFDLAKQSTSDRPAQSMSWRDFELLVGEAYRRKGFEVAETGGGGADGGVDLILNKEGKKYLVQCKHWRASKVGVSVIREVFGILAAGKYQGAMVVTSGDFTQEAQDFARGKPVQLLDGKGLNQLIGRQTTTYSPAKIEPVHHSSVSCPTCGGQMTLRTAKKGSTAGQQFWGCSSFPRCRGTRPA